MSIATKTGDAGTTALMFNRRVSKCHPRVEACGGVDELNSALGVARATTRHCQVTEPILAIQKDLILLMGELATLPEDLDRYIRQGGQQVTASMTSKLDQLVKDLERQKVAFQGWATPGASVHAAALDLARSICRRAERSVCALREQGQLNNAEILVYLNRLSDALWLLARWSEGQIEALAPGRGFAPPAGE